MIFIKHIVSFSGGKDSTAMLLKMIENNMPIDEVVYCNIMATPTIGAEYPEMYKYLDRIDEYLMKSIGKKLTRIEPKISFEEQFYTIKQGNKHKGEIYGFPYTISSWCNDRLKMKALNKYFKQQGEHIRYIGIAYDEPKRLAKLQENARAPLAEWKMTEKDCLEFLKERNLLNPLYEKFNRLGCWFCPKQSLKSLRILRRDYPELWNMLLKWQLDSEVKFKPNYTVQQLDERFENEDYISKVA